jgi:hypothetical protein
MGLKVVNVGVTEETFTIATSFVTAGSAISVVAGSAWKCDRRSLG